MYTGNMLEDGLEKAALTLRAHQLLATVCRRGGADCPLLSAERAENILERVGSDPTVTMRLTSDAGEIPHFRRIEDGKWDAGEPLRVFNRKRDLDVLQRLGLVPGSIRRSRYLYELLLERIETPDGICACTTTGWEGCPLARSGAYESIREQGWRTIVYCRSDDERKAYRRRSVTEIAEGENLFIRPHHLMCLSCWYGSTGGTEPRPNDTIYEILQRIRRDPDVLITLVEGCCMACDCCDGFHPETTRCVHAGGLIRDYKKDLDVFQKLGLMPGARMKARRLFDLLFERIASTREICGYGDGIVRSNEWGVCGGPKGNSGYEKARETGVF